jgi:hypothetical protein
MKNYFAFTASLLLASVAIFSAPAQAQNGSSSGITSPIVIHQAPTSAKPTNSTKSSSSGTWMKAEVLHSDGNSMVVAEQGNERVIHTFTYATKVQAQMRKITDKGGYQYGDKIKILYTPGNTVALKIHGKPSKAS